MSSSRPKVILVGICCSLMLSVTHAQTIPRGLKDWTLEYTAGGAIRARSMTLRLASDGQLAFSNIVGSEVTSTASNEIMQAVRKFLETAQTTKPREPGPDEPYTRLALFTGGARYELEPKAIDALLSSTAQRVLQKALVGMWWESEWHLCQPASQLRADQVDAPIESLVFADDGQFSVTWRGGGAHVYNDPSSKVPHTSLPDYSGHYVINPDYGDMRVKFEQGIYSPRDFSGDGYFQIKGEKLVLHKIWFGTYTARTKPDICVLTFTRASNTPTPQR